MKFRGEIEHENTRRGPGWWMDGSGAWQPPEQWPEDTPPLPGWTQDDAGEWNPPSDDFTRFGIDAPPRERRSSDSGTKTSKMQLRAPSAAGRPQRWLATVGFGVVALSLGVFVAITQAGADPDPPASTIAQNEAEVIFAGRTAADEAAARSDAAVLAPTVARSQLDLLRDVTEPPVGTSFEPAAWNAVGSGCLSIDEQVLIERSRTDVGFVDANDCVVDSGVWFDRFQQQQSTRATGVDVKPLIPHAVVHASGGWAWNGDTIDAFTSDVRFRAAWSIVGMDTGYNPNKQSIEEWRPSRESVWCAYAVDWIAVKHRWDLAVNAAERGTLSDMLDSCGSGDPDTMQMRELPPVEIGFASGG